MIDYRGPAIKVSSTNKKNIIVLAGSTPAQTYVHAKKIARFYSAHMQNIEIFIDSDRSMSESYNQACSIARETNTPIPRFVFLTDQVEGSSWRDYIIGMVPVGRKLRGIENGCGNEPLLAYYAVLMNWDAISHELGLSIDNLMEHRHRWNQAVKGNDNAVDPRVVVEIVVISSFWGSTGIALVMVLGDILRVLGNQRGNMELRIDLIVSTPVGSHSKRSNLHSRTLANAKNAHEHLAALQTGSYYRPIKNNGGNIAYTKEKPYNSIRFFSGQSPSGSLMPTKEAHLENFGSYIASQYFFDAETFYNSRRCDQQGAGRR